MIAFLRNLVISRRLAVAAPFGLIVFLLLPAPFSAAIRGAIAWDAGVLMFFFLTLIVVGNGRVADLRRRASLSDTHLWIILAIVVIATAASFASLAFVLQKPTGAAASTGSLVARIIVAVTTLVLSWIFVHAMFAIRYAHYFYAVPSAKGPHRGGLAFPGKDDPDFWDFMYYAFVVGMTCQVSDVQVVSRAMRRLTLAHGILAFFFNAGVLALAVNILATAL